jgi:(hydroxyamino)benzene mutase
MSIAGDPTVSLPRMALRHDRARANSGQGRVLIRSGVVLFLLGLLNGLVVHALTVPRIVLAAPSQALAAHLVALMSGTFLIAVGLVWPRLRLSRMAARLGFAAALYGFYGGWILNFLAGIWGAASVLPLSAGGAGGTAFQESLIGTGLTTVAIAMIGFCCLLIWGLRSLPVTTPPEPLAFLNRRKTPHFVARQLAHPRGWRGRFIAYLRTAGMRRSTPLPSASWSSCPGIAFSRSALAAVLHCRP